MVKPGMNQVALMLRDFRKSRMRREPTAPNSPRGHVAGDKAGLGVEIEGEANNVARHDGRPAWRRP
jgi:hypothetical protein